MMHTSDITMGENLGFLEETNWASGAHQGTSVRSVQVDAGDGTVQELHNLDKHPPMLLSPTYLQRLITRTVQLQCMYPY
jgi:hypothetical protein